MDPHPTLNATSLTAFQASTTTGNYFNVSALALLVYDYILLFNKEIDLFWNRKVTGASVLFLLNRYLPIIAYAMRPPAKMIPMPCLTCVPWAKLCFTFPFNSAAFCSNTVMQFVSQTLTFLQYIPWAAFSALRAFALYKRPYNWPMAILVFGLSIISVATNFARFYWTVPVHWTFDGKDCLVYEVRPPLNVEAYLGARACLIVADTIVLYITLRATSHKFPRLMRNSLVCVVANKRDTFSNILLRDGVVYFVVLLVMNVICLTLTMFPAQISAQTHVSFVVQLYEPLTAMLTSRFLLDLHEVDRKLGSSQSVLALSSVPPERSVVFAERVVDTGTRWSFDSLTSILREESGARMSTCQHDG